MIKRVALCLLLGLVLLVGACPKEKAGEAEEAPSKPELSETQADIAHAPRRTIDRAEAAAGRAEQAADKRLQAAEAVPEE